MISIRYSIPPPLISRYTSVISEATGFNYIAIRRHIAGFNPYFLEGSDRPVIQSATLRSRFQSTLPRRERRLIALDRTPEHKFQSTLPRRERPESLRMLPNPFGFNPRSREGSDDIPAPRLLPEGRFNPRSREGSDKNEIEEVEDFIVSIHAPAKGATDQADCAAPG